VENTYASINQHGRHGAADALSFATESE